MSPPRGGVEVRFDEQVWKAQVLQPFSERVAAVAVAARSVLEREGVRPDQIDRRYEEVGPKGTRLPACVKLYLPLGRAVSEQPFGMVLQLQSDGTLAFIAFGRRHPARRGERDVDERAHRALHGRFPGQE